MHTRRPRTERLGQDSVLDDDVGDVEEGSSTADAAQ